MIFYEIVKTRNQQFKNALHVACSLALGPRVQPTANSHELQVYTRVHQTLPWESKDQ